MPTIIAANQGRIGIALQPAEGTMVANPTFAHDLYSGLPRPEPSVNEIEVANMDEVIPGLWKSEQHWVLDLVFPGFPKAYGAYEKAFYGSLVTTGTAPKVHTGTKGVPPFVSLFAQRPGGLVERFSDGTLSALNLQHENGQPLKVNVRGMGKTSEVVGAPTPGQVEQFTHDGPVFTCIGATMKLEKTGSPAVTARTFIQTATLELTRGLTLEQTNSLTSAYRSLGRFGGGVSLTMLWEDYDLYKQTVYGAAAGTTDSGILLRSSLDFLYQVGPANDAGMLLQRQYPSVALVVPDPGDVDPGAGPLKISASGVLIKPLSGEVATDILTNDVASY